MPSSRHARMTRIAISPRLATRTLLKSLLFILQRTLLLFNWSAHSQQGLVGADDLALLDVDLAHATGDRRDDIVLHLHRLEDRDHELGRRDRLGGRSIRGTGRDGRRSGRGGGLG